MSEEAKDTLTIIGCHANHTQLSYGCAIVARFTATTSHQATTIEIYQHRQTLVHIIGWSPNVQIQTIFTARGTSEAHVAKDVWLHWIVAKGFSLTHTLPCRNRLWSLPTQIAYRSGSELHTQEFLNAVFGNTFYHTGLRLHLQSHLCSLL